MKLIHSGIFYKGVTSELKGPHYPGKEYVTGSVHTADIDLDPSKDCAPGIHVCMTIAEALRWGIRVVEVAVTTDATVVMNGKIRVGPSVKVTAIDAQKGAYLARADLTGANLARADLTGAYLARADLTQADLEGANLEGANLARADLTGAYLPGANLKGANLARADLTGAYLAGANLKGANLARADLTGANLAGADLAGAYLTGADLGSWKRDKTTGLAVPT